MQSVIQVHFQACLDKRGLHFTELKNYQDLDQ